MDQVLNLWRNFKIMYRTEYAHFTKYFEEVPLVGGLMRTRFRDHWITFGELFFIIFFALLPSLLFGFYEYVFTGDFTKSFKAIKQTISHGELYMISASLLGPISYLALIDEKTIDPFPNRTSIIFTTMAILIFASVGYISLNKGNCGGVVSEVSIQVSVYMLLLALIMVYLISVYKNARSPRLTEQTIREQQEEDSGAIMQHWQSLQETQPNITFGEN